jgi:hypothetical protein
MMTTRSVGVILLIFSIALVVGFFFLPIFDGSIGLVYLYQHDAVILWPHQPERGASILDLLNWNIFLTSLLGAVVGIFSIINNNLKRTMGGVVTGLGLIVVGMVLYQMILAGISGMKYYAEMEAHGNHTISNATVGIQLLSYGYWLMLISSAVILASGVALFRMPNRRLETEVVRET